MPIFLPNNARINAPAGVGEKDPTQTLTLRKQFAAAIRKRYRRLRGAIRETIVDNKAVGVDDIFVFNQGDPAKEKFRPGGPEQKKSEFRRWLEGAAATIFFSDRAWHDSFIRRAYAKGVASADAKVSATKAGLPDHERGKDADDILARRKHRQKLDELQNKFWSGEGAEHGGLEGSVERVTDEAAAGFSKKVDEAKPENPTDARSALVGVATGIVAEEAAESAIVHAGTAVVSTHSEATLTRFQETGVGAVSGTGGMREFMTAGDRRVCPRCLALAGTRFKPRRAQGIIPVHLSCRCTWIPVTSLSKRRSAAIAKNRARFRRRTGMDPEEIDPLNPDDPKTREAMNNWRKSIREETESADAVRGPSIDDLGTAKKAKEIENLGIRMQYKHGRSVPDMRDSAENEKIRDWLKKVRNKKLDTLSARKRRLIDNWTRGTSARKVSFEMQLAAKEKWAPNSTIYSKRFDVDDDILEQTKEDLEKIRQKTVKELREEFDGDTITLYRGIGLKGDRAEFEKQPLGGWTTDPVTAMRRAREQAKNRGGSAEVFKEEIPIEDILISHKNKDWVDGPFDGQQEFVVIKRENQ